MQPPPAIDRRVPNPAAWAGLKDILAAPSKVARGNHHAALPYAELPDFLAGLRGHDGISPRALEFVILTAARTGEVLGAKWSEIDLANKTWTILANRMKGGKEHKVPLSAPAVALLKALPREAGNDHLFLGARSERLSPASLQMLMQRLGRRDVTMHGFRSTFTDWAHERTAFSNHVIELSLAHAIGNEVEKAYRRGDLLDKRRQANGCMGHLRHLAGRSGRRGAAEGPLSVGVSGDVRYKPLTLM